MIPPAMPLILGAGFADDEHNGRTILFTSGAGKGLFYTIDDTEAANNRVECAGDNLYADGIRSGDDYWILYDIKTNLTGHNHDDVNSAILADSIIDQGRLKTSTGSASGSCAAASWANIAMQPYCFSPNYYSQTNPRYLQTAGHTSSVADQTARSSFGNDHPSAAYNYAARWRYVTATDEPFVFCIRDKNTGKVHHLWMCDDPPHPFWGLKELPDDFEQPILLGRMDLATKEKTDESHEDIIVVDGFEEITLFQYDREGIKEVEDKAGKDKLLPYEIMDKDFEFNQDKKLFVRKNLAHI